MILEGLLMKHMKTALVAGIIAASIIACPILYFLVGPALDDNQLQTLYILLAIAGGSGLYCFVVGEIAHNNSQMDKLWSLLPEIYLWIIAARGNMHPRLVIMAILATLWGARLTFNFARKGAYHIKFWAGREDYRWVVLRDKKEFQPHWKWMLFNFFFISIYQNLLVLAITLPALVSMKSDAGLNWVDFLAMGLVLLFLIIEIIADEQQWFFHSKKNKMLSEGKKLEELPAPFNKGFNTIGLWSYCRHPNYLGEQGVWLSLYIFSIGAGVGIFNWSLIGALLLVVLFLGSSMFGEEISASKYPEYILYKRKVSKFIPWRKYRPETEEGA